MDAHTFKYIETHIWCNGNMELCVSAVKDAIMSEVDYKSNVKHKRTAGIVDYITSRITVSDLIVQLYEHWDNCRLLYWSKSRFSIEITDALEASWINSLMQTRMNIPGIKHMIANMRMLHRLGPILNRGRVHGRDQVGVHELLVVARILIVVVASVLCRLCVRGHVLVHVHLAKLGLLPLVEDLPIWQHELELAQTPLRSLLRGLAHFRGVNYEPRLIHALGVLHLEPSVFILMVQSPCSPVLSGMIMLQFPRKIEPRVKSMFMSSLTLGYASGSLITFLSHLTSEHMARCTIEPARESDTIDCEIELEQFSRNMHKVTVLPYDMKSKFSTNVISILKTPGNVLYCKTTSEDFVMRMGAMQFMNANRIPAVFSFSISVKCYSCGFVHNGMDIDLVGSEGDSNQ
ncbi:hypothetical protein CFD26_100707 [Aspergillus turcosus]|uniref:Uncharacterized protein n=1 Tax=Aspergillus turcosus TaxID=1245748 RepID=A0A421CU52_9EURO|nr:hypothetical protein CFD26_100707 [Aspergillus turcosus]